MGEPMLTRDRHQHGQQDGDDENIMPLLQAYTAYKQLGKGKGKVKCIYIALFL